MQCVNKSAFGITMYHRKYEPWLRICISRWVGCMVLPKMLYAPHT